MADRPGSSGPQLAQHCYRHPDREAYIRCTRCDRPICPDCMHPASVGFHCPDDVRAGARSVRAPRNALGASLRQNPPYVTISLIVLNVATYLVSGTQTHATLQDPRNSRLFLDWQLFPLYLHDKHEYYQLVTSAFLHLTPLHIATNMISLAIVGPVLERAMGPWRYLAVYLLSALGGSAAIYAFGNAFGTTAGASGAIFGLFGACLVLVRRLGLNTQWLVGTIVLNFIITFSVPNISKLGHIGGFVTGALAAVVIAGLPTARRKIAPRLQAAGLTGVLLLVVLVVGVRTATW
ncbi:rhomboid family intramembrane serine protease [uncultured Jatrophihabitans sp.]|uniref:rhomboid family intramembrane serine protease n=1 Tax=uncultured Jatrophihabitans sp. TaxID=1610747 RepID=UPI0035C9F62F